MRTALLCILNYLAFTVMLTAEAIGEKLPNVCNISKAVKHCASFDLFAITNAQQVIRYLHKKYSGNA